MPDNWLKMTDDGDNSAWKCNKCNRKFRGETHPQRHTCRAEKKNQRTPNGNNQILSPGENETPRRRGDSSRTESVNTANSVAQPNATAGVGSVPALSADQITLMLVEQMKAQQEMQKLMMMQTKNMEEMMTAQKDQIKRSLETAEKDRKEKEEATKEVIEIFKQESLNSKRIPCPKWTKDG